MLENAIFKTIYHTKPAQHHNISASKDLECHRKKGGETTKTLIGIEARYSLHMLNYFYKTL